MSWTEGNLAAANVSLLGKWYVYRGACDACRRSKVRCDGIDKSDRKCTYCVGHQLECTYVAVTKRLLTPRSYVQSLENRIEAMGQLLKQLLPGIDLSDVENLGDSIAQPRNGTKEEEEDDASALNLRLVRFLRFLQSQHANQLDAEDEAILTVDEVRKRNMADKEYRFLGKSSIIILTQAARDIKTEYAKTSAPLVPPYNSFQETTPSEDQVSSAPQTGSRRRPEFQTTPPWERAITTQPACSNVPTFPVAIPSHVFDFEPPKNAVSNTQNLRSRYTFPPQDLMLSLVDLYFEHSNTIMPLLHKPTFLRHLAEERHLQGGEEGDGFGATVLLICSVASRWSSDPKVLLDGEQRGGWHSSGWKWFNQVQLVRKSLLQPAKLWDLQLYCLSVLFIQATSVPQTCWPIIGIGIRLAQEVGAHRRRIRKPPQANVKLGSEKRKRLARERMEEEWARAWWVLVVLDRMASAGMGRPCAILDEDFDLELPLEVDDEHWEDPSGEDDLSQMFRQPNGKPSSISFFIQLIKLMRLLAFSLRTVYAIHRRKLIVTSGLPGQELERNMVIEIDSALNRWLENVPAHLRWNPNQPNRTFFNQSVVLYSQYYELQILVHRPFIPSPRRTSVPSLPSLAICTNAARACAHMIDIHRRRILKEAEDCEGDRGTLGIHPHALFAAFISGIVLSLNIWLLRQAGRNETALSRDMESVNKCLTMLELAEKRWHHAGRFRDILSEITSMHNLSRHTGDMTVPERLPHPVLNLTTNPTADCGRLTTVDDPSRLLSYLSVPPESWNLPAYPDEFDLLLHRLGVTDDQPPRYQPGQHLSHSASRQDESMGMDRDTMNVWPNASTGFEINDWAAYLDLG